MRAAMITFAAAFAGNVFAGIAAAPLSLTPRTINEAQLAAVLDEPATDPSGAALPSPAVVRLQVLLDRAGASPGVIDGIFGANVRKAIAAAETMFGLPVDGRFDSGLAAHLDQGGPAVGHYTVTAADVADIGLPVPTDYAAKARRDHLGYESAAEALAERFHMDIDLLEALNPRSDFAVGDRVYVAAYGPDRSGTVAYVEADTRRRQVRAYDAAGRLLVAYPATIGSRDNPSPSGIHTITAVAPMPTYSYDPALNFQQGDNTEALTIPPGPNGPVGTVWIDLSAPTYGIHGTPDPALIDKVASHGCVRLTNWDAEELAAMVNPGVSVVFTGG